MCESNNNKFIVVKKGNRWEIKELISPGVWATRTDYEKKEDAIKHIIELNKYRQNLSTNNVYDIVKSVEKKIDILLKALKSDKKLAKQHEFAEEFIAEHDLSVSYELVKRQKGL